MDWQSLAREGFLQRVRRNDVHIGGEVVSARFGVGTVIVVAANALTAQIKVQFREEAALEAVLLDQPIDLYLKQSRGDRN